MAQLDVAVVGRFIAPMPWQTDTYPARCPGCGARTELKISWGPAGEARKEWAGIERARINVVQPRHSTGEC